MINDYAIQNALIERCEKIKKEMKGVPVGDPTTPARLKKYYQDIKMVLPGVSYYRFIYELGIATGSFKRME